ncbi:PKD domain-containing protein [Aeromonas salmonicida]
MILNKDGTVNLTAGVIEFLSIKPITNVNLRDFFKTLYPNFPTDLSTCQDYLGPNSFFDTFYANSMGEQGYDSIGRQYPRDDLGGVYAFNKIVPPSGGAAIKISLIEHQEGNEKIVETIPLITGGELSGSHSVYVSCSSSSAQETLVTYYTYINYNELHGRLTKLPSISGPISLRISVNDFFAVLYPSAYIQSEQFTLPWTISAPIADAGEDQSTTSGSMVQLDGSGSTDPNGDILDYTWQQAGVVEGEAPIILANANTATPSFTAPNVPLGGKTFTFLLTVTANGVRATDIVNVSIANLNNTPVAEAGSDQQVSEGTSTVRVALILMVTTLPTHGYKSLAHRCN